MTSALFWLYLLIASWDILTLFKILFVIVITDCHTQQGAESISLEPKFETERGESEPSQARSRRTGRAGAAGDRKLVLEGLFASAPLSH